MFRRDSSIFTILGFLLFSLITITSCEKDIIEEETSSIGHELSGTVFTYKRLIETNPAIGDLTQPFTQNFNAKSGNTHNGIQIDTSRVRLLESSFYKSYTFQVVQDSIEKQQVLRNYVLTIFNDSLNKQMIVEYPVITMDNTIFLMLLSPQYMVIC